VAPLHLASENLDPDLVSQMFSFPLGVVQIHHKTHMWSASTDPLSGLTPGPSGGPDERGGEAPPFHQDSLS